VLPVLAFENATKRNRPELKLGDMVFARVVSCHVDLDPELSCTDAHGKASGYGPLRDGYVCESSSQHVLKLRSPKPPPEIRKLPSSLKWESVVGANGRIWVKSTSVQITAALVQVLRDCALLYDEDEVESVIDRHRLALKLDVKG
jgi:exosome complex component RRP40